MYEVVEVTCPYCAKQFNLYPTSITGWERGGKNLQYWDWKLVSVDKQTDCCEYCRYLSNKEWVTGEGAMDWLLDRPPRHSYELFDNSFPYCLFMPKPKADVVIHMYGDNHGMG